MTSGAESEPTAYPIVLRGQLVALAGRERCYLLIDDLPAADRRLVLMMCLCSREVRAGRLQGPWTPALAERWARLLLDAARRDGVAVSRPRPD